MILTEKEAQAKRCTPMMVVLLVDRDVRNGHSAGGMEVGVNCIGCKCMQWNWYDYADANGETFRHPSNSFSKGHANITQATANSTGAKKLPARGYCGLTFRAE